MNFTGRHRLATAVNGSVLGPTLRWREGDTVTLLVTNRLKTMSSIHWRAIRLPANMDGVPGLSFPGIPPNKTIGRSSQHARLDAVSEAGRAIVLAHLGGGIGHNDSPGKIADLGRLI